MLVLIGNKIKKIIVFFVLIVLSIYFSFDLCGITTTGYKLSKNDESVEVNQKMYRSMIGKLQYVVHRRPDIALVVGVVERFSANPRENHLMAVKRIMRYLKGTHDFGLYYKRSEKFELNVYIDVD